MLRRPRSLCGGSPGHAANMLPLHDFLPIS